jgi:hypothetical protein
MAVPTILHAESFAWSNSDGIGLYAAGTIYSHFSLAYGGRNDWLTGSGRGSPAGGTMWGAWGGPDFGDAITGWDVPTPSSTIGVAFAASQGASATNGAINYGNSRWIELWTENPDPLVPGGYTAGYNYFTGRILVFGVDPTGHLVVRAGDNRFTLATTYGTSSAIMPPGRASGPANFSHLELIADTSTGNATVRMEGSTILTITGAGFAGLGNVGHVRFCCGDGRYLCDLVIHDGSDFIGDCRVDYFPANIAGTYQQGAIAGTGSPTSLLDCVDDDPIGNNPDGDFISMDDTSLPKTATFGTADLPSNVTTVYAVIPQAIVRKDDAGINQGRLMFLSGATTTDGGADITLGTDWRTPQRIHQTNPDTSAAWTVSEANAVEVGWRRTV